MGRKERKGKSKNKRKFRDKRRREKKRIRRQEDEEVVTGMEAKDGRRGWCRFGGRGERKVTE